MAKLTNQRKEDIIFWINQKDHPYPVDKLSKFDIDKDGVDKWMELDKCVLVLDWLQKHPIKYLDKMLKNLREQVKLLKQGGKVQPMEEQQKYLSEEVSVNYVECQEGYALVSSFKENPYDSSMLQIITYKKNIRELQSAWK